MRELPWFALEDVRDLDRFRRPGDGLGAGTRDRREHLCKGPPQRRPLGRDQQVLLDVHVVEQLDRLEGACHATMREPVRGMAGDVDTVEAHVPAGRGGVRP